MQAPEILPLREDLHLFPAATEADGSPTWVIQDPVSNRFFRIGWAEYECLLRWPNQAAKIAEDVSLHTALELDEAQVNDFAQFLEKNYLLQLSPQGVERLKEQLQKAPSWKDWRWWLRNYLFVRVPLIKPMRFLDALTRCVEPLFSMTALWCLLGISLLGLILVMRQWDVFTHSVVELFSPTGLLGFALALVFSKALHELGHAVVATRQGVRVAHMGVAFLVMWPMLYTDTGESWRLRSHRQRLAISIAGVSTELALAGLATFFWAILDDGVLRQAMLYLATTAWVLSLALNVSPFMRFDGYFILSDCLNFPNLHERAGLLAKTRLRRAVLGVSDPDPEPFSPAVGRSLMWFAYATWLYRLGVFLTIAWMVYTLFFKALGIFLLVVEILWFVARPIWSELVVWHERWPEVKPMRRKIYYGLIGGVLLLLAVPWAFKIEAPAVALPSRQQVVYGPFPAQLLHVQAAGTVTQGTELVRFEAPDLAAQQKKAQALAHAFEQRLAGIMADERGSQEQQATLRRIYEQQAESYAIEEEAKRLSIQAEFDGVWVDVDPIYKKGVWVDDKTALGVVIDPEQWIVDAYVEQRDVERIQLGAPARFYFSVQSKGVDAEVVAIDPTRSQRALPILLDARYGGSIAVQEQEGSQGVPLNSYYRVRLALAEPIAMQQEMKGTIQIEGQRRSLLWAGFTRLLSILIRESGF